MAKLSRPRGGCGPPNPFLPYPYVCWLDYMVTVVTVCLRKSCCFLRVKPLPCSILGVFRPECVLNAAAKGVFSVVLHHVL